MTYSISCIVPTVGRSSVECTLAALERQTRPPDEIIVVRDSERAGPAATRNRAILQAKGTFVACVDDDAIPPDDWLERLIEAQHRFGADVVGGTFEETDPLLMEIRRRRTYPAQVSLDNGGHVGNSGNIMYRRELLMQSRNDRGECFSTLFRTFGAEDWELMMRLRANGARVVYTPCTVQHLKRLTTSSYLRHQFKRGVGVALLHRAYLKHPAPGFFQPSNLWSTERWFVVRYAKLLLRHIIGPFDVSSFRSLRNFLVFWVGSKAFALGYLQGRFIRIERLVAKRTSPGNFSKGTRELNLR